MAPLKMVPGHSNKSYGLIYIGRVTPKHSIVFATSKSSHRPIAANRVGHFTELDRVGRFIDIVLAQSAPLNQPIPVHCVGLKHAVMLASRPCDYSNYKPSNCCKHHVYICQQLLGK